MPLQTFRSRLIADVGISAGDEGKGRLVYELARELQARHGPRAVALVLKVNGGANSGHTAAGLKHNLVPCGCANPAIERLALGAGVVADPRKLDGEVRWLEYRAHHVRERLLIDERTMVSDLTHRLLDFGWDHYRVHVLGGEARGSTRWGISPAFADETSQWQMTYGEFLGDRAEFERRLAARADRAGRTLEHVCRVRPEDWFAFLDQLTQSQVRAQAEGIAAGVFREADFDCRRFAGPRPFTLDTAALAEALWAAGQSFAGQIGDVREAVLGAVAAGRHVLAEFGQAFWLDKRHGFPPNVTASHTFTPELFQSAGIPVQPVHVVGNCKAYDTKVGTHVFLTQMPEDHPLARRLRTIEFGTTTGRQRMVGWFDAVEKGDALRYGGFDDLMINKLDPLKHEGDWSGDLLLCTAYEDDSGRRHFHVPRNDAVRRRLRPVYERHPGWAEDLSGVRRFADLPPTARSYVAAMVRAVLRVAENGGATAPRPQVRYLGVGPAPDQVIADVPSTDELLALAP